MEKKLIEIESRRKKLLVKYIIVGILYAAAIIMVAVLAVCNLWATDDIVPLLVVSILTCFIMFLAVVSFRKLPKQKKAFVSFYKENFVTSVVEDLYKGVVYQAAKRISTSVIESAHMVNVGNTVNGDDYISAQYRDIDFVHCDLHIQNITSSGRSKYKKTYFKGKWMYFDFHKDFSNYVIIREKADVFEKANHPYDYGEKIMFESMDFNKEFDVFAADQHTAFYIITPQFIESLRKLRDKTEGQLILGFINGKMHIAINSGRNTLEPSILRKIDEYYIHSIRHELQVINNFIDELLAEKPDFRVGDKASESDYNDPELGN